MLLRSTAQLFSCSTLCGHRPPGEGRVRAVPALGTIATVLLVLIIMLALCSPSFAADAIAQSAPRQVSLWVADESTKIDPTGKPLVYKPLPNCRTRNGAWDSSTSTVSLFAARNEYAAFQLIIEAGDAALKSVTVTPSALKSASGSIPAKNFALYGEWYTTVTRPSKSPMLSMGPGAYPDGLVPMALPEYSKFDVPARTVQAVWIDLYVPSDARPGLAKGALLVKADGAAPRTVNVALTVWDFALPAESHLRWRVGYNEALASANGVPFDRHTSKVGQQFLDLELKFYRMCHAHRITPTTHYTSPLPDTAGKGDALTIDWASYDKRFGKYLDGSAFDDHVPVNIFSLPVNPQSYNGWPSSTRYRNNIDLPSFRKAMQLTVKHWQDKGWNLDNAFVYVADEPDARRADLIKQHCQAVKDASPRVHRSVALYTIFGTNGPNIVKEYRGFINYWEVAGDYMNRPALTDVQKDGDWVGIYQGSEPFEGGEALDMDGLALTTWPWIAWAYRLDSLFIYNSTEWKTDDIWTNPNNQGWVTNSQGVLFYPGLKVGVKEVLPSIRLKEMRRGMQDYEYFWLLKKSGKADLADEIAKGIIHSALSDAATPMGEKYFGPAKWERDPSSWSSARTRMAQALATSQPK